MSKTTKRTILVFEGEEHELHPPIELPKWWSADDTHHCNEYRRWNRTEDAELQGIDYNEFTCRRCAYWQSLHGKVGQCDGPELQCGKTKAFNTCEQWTPRI